MTSSLFPVNQVPSEKGSILKGKNLLPVGSKFFPFRKDTFTEGSQQPFERVITPKSVSISLKHSSK